MEGEIGSPEIRALKKKRGVECPRDRVRHAVAKVQSGRMATFAEAIIRLRRSDEKLAVKRSKPGPRLMQPPMQPSHLRREMAPDSPNLDF